MEESVHTSMIEPDNHDVALQQREKIRRLTAPPPIEAAEKAEPERYGDLDLGLRRRVAITQPQPVK